MDLKECYRRMGGSYDEMMRRMRQEERVVKFLRLFPKDESFALLTQALPGEDWPAAFRAAHTLKGVALNLGLADLAGSSSALTEALRGGEPAQDPAPLYEAVRRDYEAAVAAISALDGAAGGN